MGVLKKLWWGQYPLWKTFWLFFALGGYAIIIVGIIIYMPFVMVGLGPIGFIAVAIIVWGYWVVSSVGVWRSANAYPLTKGWPPKATIGWPTMAKCGVGLLWLVALYRLANGGLAGVLDRIGG
jgi:hypothetical protein